MSPFLDEYRAEHVRAWTRSRRLPLRLLDIPPSKAELRTRVSTFDGGHTLAWLRTLESTSSITWRAVRDVDTGHTVHIVSDRAALAPDFVADLNLMLHILRFLTRGAPVVVYAWDQVWPRVLPPSTLPGREHINGGWAVPGVREVHVYRREEIHKVIIHECIHALSLDVPHAAMIPLRHSLEGQDLGLGLGRTLWPHLGECYTELLAEWLWTVIQGRDGSTSHAARRWAAQLQCSRGQAIQVWARIRHSRDKPEDTNVFAYYVLKAVLMEHVEEVLGTATRSIAHWLNWWRAARPELNRAADRLIAESTFEIQGMRMGMTCAH